VLGPLEDQLKRGPTLGLCECRAISDGLCMPLAEMAELCRKYGAEIAVDAIQAAGCGALCHRRLGSRLRRGRCSQMADGSRRRRIPLRAPRSRARLEPGALPVGSVTKAHSSSCSRVRVDSTTKQPLVPSARVFEAGSGSVISCARAGSGARRHSWCWACQPSSSTSRGYLDELQLGLEARGLAHVRAEYASGRSGILSLRVPGVTVGSRSSSRAPAQGDFACSTSGWFPEVCSAFSRMRSPKCP
jgi:hypothetical protein